MGRDCQGLAGSADPVDRKLSTSIIEYVSQSQSVRSMHLERTQRGQQPLPSTGMQRDAGAMQPRASASPAISR